MFSAPAAPEPKATAKREKIVSTKLIFVGAISRPTAHVKLPMTLHEASLD